MATSNELSNLVNGVWAKTYAISGDIDLMGPDNPWRDQKKPARGFAIDSGVIEIELCDDADPAETVVTTDMGGAYYWPIQGQKIIAAGTTATSVTVIW